MPRWLAFSIIKSRANDSVREDGQREWRGMSAYARRRDRISDRGSVIILKGWPEDGFFRMLFHSDERALSLRAFGPEFLTGLDWSRWLSLLACTMCGAEALPCPFPKPLLCFQAR